MGMKMGWCMGMVALLTLWEQASYVENCEIMGKVLQDTSTRKLYLDGPYGEYEVFDLNVALRIQKLQQSGRADSLCEAFKPRMRLEVKVSPAPLVVLHQGQRVRLQYFKKHNQGQAATESYQLLQP